MMKLFTKGHSHWIKSNICLVAVITALILAGCSEPAPAPETSEAPSSAPTPEPVDDPGEAPKAPKANATMPGMIGPAVKKIEPPPTAFPPTTQP